MTRAAVPHAGSGVAECVLRRYEMWVRTVLSPAVADSFPVPTESTRVPRQTVRRLHVPCDRDITAVLRRLAECGVEVLDLRVATSEPESSC